MEGETKIITGSFVGNVFLWMFAALGITALTAYLVSNTQLSELLFRVSQNGGFSMAIYNWVIVMSPLIIIYLMSEKMDRLNVSQLTGLYLLYSLLMGVSLSSIFTAYSSISIFKTFIITSAMFGVMAMAGYTTKADLSKFGPILLMGLIGIIIAIVVNYFMHSQLADYITSIIGIAIFTGFTAYDMKNIRKIAEAGIDNKEIIAKLTVQAAFSLYMDFINLFLFQSKFSGKSNKGSNKF